LFYEIIAETMILNPGWGWQSPIPESGGSGGFALAPSPPIENYFLS